MKHKTPSILSQFALIQKTAQPTPHPHPCQLFTHITPTTTPHSIRHKLQQLSCPDTSVIKTIINPYGHVVCFYICFLKLYFVQRQQFQRCVDIWFQIIDDDQFVVEVPKSRTHPLFIDWSTSKIKRVAAEYFRQVLSGQYDSIDQILQRNLMFSKILFLLSWSLLYAAGKVESFEDQVKFDDVKDVLFDGFGFELYESQGAIWVPCASILIENLNDTELYLINVPLQQEELESETTRSLQITQGVYDQNFANQFKLQFLETGAFLQENDINSSRTMHFEDLTNRSNTNEQHETSNDKKTQRSKKYRFPSLKYSKQGSENSFSRDFQDRRYKTENDEVKWVQQKQQKQQQRHEIDRLFELTSRTTNTQKSLYDDAQQQVQGDEYSVLDDYLPTSKRLSERPSSKENHLTQSNTQSVANGSLLNKWYEFCKVRKNKSQNMQSNKVVKVQVKPEIVYERPVERKSHFQESNEKPDFRKIKSRRRKSQDLDESDKSNQTSTKNSAIQKQKSLQPSISTTPTPSSPPPKKQQFLLHNPHKKPHNKTDNLYSKLGYVNMNISEEFTDSLILKELSEKNQENIKAMKDKAREERASIKMEVEKKKGKCGEVV